MATRDQVEGDIIRLLGEKIEGDLKAHAGHEYRGPTPVSTASASWTSSFELEDEFGITVPLDRISDVKTVGQLTDAVYGLMQEDA